MNCNKNLSHKQFVNNQVYLNTVCNDKQNTPCKNMQHCCEKEYLSWTVKGKQCCVTVYSDKNGNKISLDLNCPNKNP